MNSHPRFGRPARPRLAAALVFALSSATLAAAPVSPKLSADTFRAGEGFEIVYDFTSVVAKEPAMPRTIAADGLRITLDRKKSSDWVLLRQYKYVYTVTAERPGEFRIPALKVRAGKGTVETRGVGLKVEPGPGKPWPPDVPAGEPPPFYPFNKPAKLPLPAPVPSGFTAQPAPPGAAPRAKPQAPVPALPAPPPARAAENRSAFGEMEVGQAKAFVGEVVPVTLRYYLRADLVFDGPLQQPYIAGDGFAALPLREVTPPQPVKTLHGADYNVIEFRTAVVPARAGGITVPPAVMKGRMLVGRGWTQQPGGLPAPAGGELKDFEVSAPGRQIGARDVPLAGRPDTFTGAVGEFAAAAPAAHPPRVGPGEPAKLKLAVSGHGNFAAMQPPLLNRLHSWRDYKPEVTMADTAEPGSGTKTFEFTLMARQDENATPGAALSFFDPKQERYVTLRFDPVPMTAEAPLEGKDFVAVTQPEPAPTPVRLRGATPILRSPWFYAMQAVLIVVFAAWALTVAVRRRMARRADDAAARLAADLRAAVAALRDAGQSPAEFYAAAARAVMARLAISQGKPAAATDAASLLARAVDDPARRERLLAVLSRNDELNYGAHESAALAPGERESVSALVGEFCEKSD